MDVSILPHLAVSTGTWGKASLRDLRELSLHAAGLRINLVITSLSCNVLAGLQHHSKVGIYDLRASTLTQAQGDALIRSLRQAGWAIEDERLAPANKALAKFWGPHIHVESPRRCACPDFTKPAP